MESKGFSQAEHCEDPFDPKFPCFYTFSTEKRRMNPWVFRE